jgi:hypothetical protein
MVKAKAMVPRTMVAKSFLILMLMDGAMRCDWVMVFGL